ncbi:hypothetical protein VTN96DRAFT_6456 [Rasamsonia emersonii]
MLQVPEWYPTRRLPSSVSPATHRALLFPCSLFSSDSHRPPCQPLALSFLLSIVEQCSLHAPYIADQLATLVSALPSPTPFQSVAGLSLWFCLAPCCHLYCIVAKASSKRAYTDTQPYQGFSLLCLSLSSSPGSTAPCRRYPTGVYCRVGILEQSFLSLEHHACRVSNRFQPQQR